MSQQFPYGVGLSNVGSYQVSGVPYATSSIAVPASSSTPIEVAFPDITQRVVVENTSTGADLRVGFSSNGVRGSNYFLIKAASANAYSLQDFRVKVSSIYLLSHTATPTSASVFAELTNIATSHLNNSGPNGVGNNWSGSVGVG